MATIDYAITSKAKVKAHLGITDTNSDALLDMLVYYVTDFIEGYCGGRRFKRGTVSNETHDTDNIHNVFLRNFPIASLTSVEYRSGTVSSPVWNTFTAEGYLLYGDEGYVHFFSKLPKVMQGIRFTYVAGFLIDFANDTDSALHTLPYDLTWVATELVARLFTNKGTDGIKNMSTEGQSVMFADPGQFLNGLHASILGKYQAVRLTK
jgi:hypothetical protein